jgi:hypothetical protein
MNLPRNAGDLVAGSFPGDPCQVEGAEILVYDHRRRPPCWSRIIQPHQCAVFLRDEELGVAVGRDARPPGKAGATCLLFESIDGAERFCRRMVAEHPQLSCEILDARGRSNPPLMTITREHAGGDDDVRGWFPRHRRSVIVALIATALALFWFDYCRRGDLIMTVFGVNLLAAALRLLLWDSAAKNNERDRIARLETHRLREQAAGPEDGVIR